MQSLLMRSLLGLALAVGAVSAQAPAVITPQRSVPQRPAYSPQDATRTAQDILVGPEDSLNIYVLNATEISKDWRVGPNGELSLPMAGVIQVTGMTVRELTAELTERLKKYILEPQVSIYVAEQRSRPVMVTGAVEKPGTYQMGGQKTLFEILLMAGGPREAGPRVSIRRNMADGALHIPGVQEYEDEGYHFADLDIQEVMSGRGEKAMFALRPHDIVSVSVAAAPRYVHIAGEVVRPGAVELVTQDTVSLLRVVATAGGPTAVAKLGKTMIMHIRNDGAQAESPVFIDLKKIMEGKAQDISLQAGEIVILNRSGVKAFLDKATTAAMSTGVSSTVLVLARL